MSEKLVQAQVVADDLAKLMLRLLLAGTMLFHGVSKITNAGAIDHIQGLLTERGLPGFMVYGAFVGELLAPAFIIIGLFTRASAVVVALTMVFALYLVHPHELFAVTERGIWAIELQAYFMIVAIAVALLGGGRFAIFKGEGLLN